MILSPLASSRRDTSGRARRVAVRGARARGRTCWAEVLRFRAKTKGFHVPKPRVHTFLNPGFTTFETQGLQGSEPEVCWVSEPGFGFWATPHAKDYTLTHHVPLPPLPAPPPPLSSSRDPGTSLPTPCGARDTACMPREPLAMPPPCTPLAFLHGHPHECKKATPPASKGSVPPAQGAPGVCPVLVGWVGREQRASKAAPTLV